MTLGELTSVVLLRPEIANLSKTVVVDGALQRVAYTELEKTAAITGYVPLVIAEIINSYDFDFAVGETTFPGGTTANTATYRLEGEDEDARDIISVKYDTNEYDLDRLDDVEYDRKYSGQTRPTEVVAWMLLRRENDFPLIQLVGTPTLSGKQIKYRYRKTTISLESFPKAYTYVVVDGVVSKINAEGSPVFIDSLQKMIARATQGRSDDNMATISKDLTNFFRHLNNLQGY